MKIHIATWLYRPTAEEVLSHCVFWSYKKQLDFFQDVSDRLESEDSNSPIKQNLELRASEVCEGDWTTHIDKAVVDG